jgi:hypothetical protein
LKPALTIKVFAEELHRCSAPAETRGNKLCKQIAETCADIMQDFYANNRVAPKTEARAITAVQASLQRHLPDGPLKVSALTSTMVALADDTLSAMPSNQPYERLQRWRMVNLLCQTLNELVDPNLDDYEGQDVGAAVADAVEQRI